MIKRHTISFKNAFNGLLWAIKTQPNYRVHLLLTAVALGVGYLLQISYHEWLVILVLICLGLAIETVNTSLEATTDAIDSRWREDIKIAKDVAAAAMLIFAVGAFFIAGIIFIPKLITYFSNL